MKATRGTAPLPPALLAAALAVFAPGEAAAVGSAAGLAGGVPALQAPLPDSGFVRAEAGEFRLGGRSLHYTGANCYYLMVYAADPALRPAVDEVLEDAASAGVSVMRTWAFNDGPGWHALQTSPGVHDETVFEGLDYVLEKARSLGIRLVLPLVNNWTDYGGMDQYVAWSPTAVLHDDFYTDPDCRAWYRDNAAVLTGRINSINGRRYRDDPTILAWELANEPRCPSDPSGTTLAGWIADMSAHLKSLDPNHLVTTGLEGFFADTSGPWYLNGSQGVDFVRDHQAPDVDFAVAHGWPDSWGLTRTQTMNLLSRQIGAARGLGKPFVLEEFGKLRDGAALAPRAHYNPATWFAPGMPRGPVPGAAPQADVPSGAARAPFTAPPPVTPPAPAAGTTQRDLYFAAWYDSLAANACGGSHFWILYHDAYPDYDGFGVYAPADSGTLALVAANAAAMAALDAVSGVGPGDPGAGVGSLGPAWPNPFRSILSIPLRGLTGGGPVRLVVFDVLGRRIRTLVDGAPAAGGLATWDGRDDRGRPVPAGSYFISFSAPGASASRRIALLR